MLKRISEGRRKKTEDFAGAVIFLFSKGSVYNNGESITVNGGWLVK